MLAKPRRAPRVESVRYGVKSTPNAPIYYPLFIEHGALRVASLALFAPALEAGREDRFEIALRRSGEPKACRRVSGYAFSAVVMG